MAICRTVLVCAVVAFSVGGLAATAAAQGKKKPSAYPGTAVFRCNGWETPCLIDGAPASDRIIGDFTKYEGKGSPEGGEGAHLRVNTGDTNHEMWIGIRNLLRVYINFGGQDSLAPCTTSGNGCYYPGAFSETDDVLIGATYAEIQSQVVDEYNDVTATLLDIPLYATWQTRLYIGFNDASGRLWNFNFSDTRSNGTTPDSRNAFVKRLGPCSWEFTDGGRLAELSTLVRVSGKQFRSFEGVYSAPFLITFEAPTCPGTVPQ